MGSGQRAVVDYNKLCALLLIGALVYGEFGTYYSAYSRSPSLKWPWSKSLRILLVADSQLQGDLYENPPPVGSLTRWDSDRYLSKTFSWALYAYKPQVVIFLGDLIDEGSEGEDEAFEDYAGRFKAIYHSAARTIVRSMIYVAGDNDIGGEGRDPITEHKVQRFQKHFPSKPIHIYRGVSGFEISEDDPTLTKDNDTPSVEIIPVNFLLERQSGPRPLSAKKPKDLRLVVSHLPIMPTPFGEFSANVLQRYQPSVIFSAHDHRGMDFMGMRKTGRSNGNITLFSPESVTDPDLLTVKAVEDEQSWLHEVVVPTCSYRMGSRHMAFGIVEIAPNSEGILELHYANAWLPSRFATLYLYLATLLTCSLLYCLGRCRPRRKRHPSSSCSSGSAVHYSKLV